MDEAEDTPVVVNALDRLEGDLVTAFDAVLARHVEMAIEYPTYGAYLGVTALLRLASRRMAAIIDADPAQHPRCQAMVDEVTRCIAPVGSAGARMH